MNPTKQSPKSAPTDFTDIILRAYFGRRVPTPALAAAIDRLGLDGMGYDNPQYSELGAAVPEVLLLSVSDGLPQWALVSGDQVELGRRASKRPASPERYRPQHLFTVNWADSSPGFSWPTAYYATAVEWAKKVVITGSADGEEMFGFADFAIGHFPLEQELLDGAGQVIVEDWRKQAKGGQPQWVGLFDEALVDTALAEAWAAQVWPGDNGHV